jgi:hypothetical protein
MHIHVWTWQACHWDPKQDQAWQKQTQAPTWLVNGKTILRLLQQVTSKENHALAVADERIEDEEDLILIDFTRNIFVFFWLKEAVPNDWPF